MLSFFPLTSSNTFHCDSWCLLQAGKQIIGKTEARWIANHSLTGSKKQQIHFYLMPKNSWTDLTLLNAGLGRVVVVERFCTMILPLITEKKQTVKIFFFNVIPSRFFHTKQVLLHHTWIYLIVIFWVFLKLQDYSLVIYLFITWNILRPSDHGVMTLLFGLFLWSDLLSRDTTIYLKWYSRAKMQDKLQVC